jgi:cell wall-associated NlpC family hydrolase
VEVNEAEYDSAAQALTPEWVTALEYNGHPMMVPMGSQLTAMKNGKAKWRKNQVHYKGRIWDPAAAGTDPKSIRQLTYKFLNTPYLWGGKSVFGIDCSGFTQSVFKFMGISLLRDAYQQAGQGEQVGFLEETRTGDLAFFDNDEGHITHVGILLNTNEIIHASGKVRIDKIDNMGIVQSETSERTHHLRLIKRLLVEK